MYRVYQSKSTSNKIEIEIGIVYCVCVIYSVHMYNLWYKHNTYEDGAHEPQDVIDIHS